MGNDSSPKPPRDEAAWLASKIARRARANKADAPLNALQQAEATLTDSGALNPETHYLASLSPDGRPDIQPLLEPKRSLAEVLDEQAAEADREDAPLFILQQREADLIEAGLINPETHYLAGFTPDGSPDIRPLPAEA